MANLIRKMREPRKAKAFGLSSKAWYYVNDRSIDLFINADGCKTMTAKLTRRQLEQALAIMNKV